MQTHTPAPIDGAVAARTDAAQRIPRAGWRSHTFADGTRSVTLASTLDASTIARLRARLRELGERDCDRLIVDLSAAVESDEQAASLLADVLEDETAGCEVVAVVPRDRALDDHLPARIAVAWSLNDARALLATRPPRRAPRRQPAPADAISAGERHALAIRQVLRWAAQTAGRGDYENALRALKTIERIEGRLPGDWPERRAAWEALRSD